MLNIFIQLLLTFCSTSWVIVIFGLCNDWSIFSFPTWLSSILLLGLTIILSAISMCLLRFYDSDNLFQCSEVEDAMSSFLPTYLGYFFIGLSLEKLEHLFFIYGLIFVFSFLSQHQYYNPILLLFGYRFYNITTIDGTKLFIITERELRKAKDVSFTNLKRLNNTTFFEWKEKD